jgi:hypothetical protein
VCWACVRGECSCGLALTHPHVRPVILGVGSYQKHRHLRQWVSKVVAVADSAARSRPVGSALLHSLHTTAD